MTEVHVSEDGEETYKAAGGQIDFVLVSVAAVEGTDPPEYTSEGTVLGYVRAEDQEVALQKVHMFEKHTRKNLGHFILSRVAEMPTPETKKEGEFLVW